MPFPNGGVTNVRHRLHFRLHIWWMLWRDVRGDVCGGEVREGGEVVSSEFTCKKSTVEKYDIRWNRGEWALFTIDLETNTMQCHSSFGDYAYTWSSPGESFKRFLIGLEKDCGYLLNKVSRPVFDFDESIKRWKKMIIDYRRDGSIDKEAARDCWQVVVDCESYGVEEEGYCYSIVADSSTITEHFFDAWETFAGVKTFPAAAMTFGKVIWPMLCKVLREEQEQQP